MVVDQTVFGNFSDNSSAYQVASMLWIVGSKVIEEDVGAPWNSNTWHNPSHIKMEDIATAQTAQK